MLTISVNCTTVLQHNIRKLSYYLRFGYFNLVCCTGVVLFNNSTMDRQLNTTDKYNDL